MSELTKEYLDQAVSGLATKQDLKGLATRQDVREGVEELARITSAGFDEMRQRLDVTAQIQSFERKFKKLEEALHIQL